MKPARQTAKKDEAVFRPTLRIFVMRAPVSFARSVKKELGEHLFEGPLQECEHL